MKSKPNDEAMAELYRDDPAFAFALASLMAFWKTATKLSC